ncbi:hypothetical protein RRG08_063815 [Elysia crispata]|uniref:Uncharacterized protein n=1 Tax=Elysia crispata TaxID=231223 RepID=A0AAE1D0P5_9GAST|nr:hypothetical protein RRG08_063815 [Elysia crispata]
MGDEYCIASPAWVPTPPEIRYVHFDEWSRDMGKIRTNVCGGLEEGMGGGKGGGRGESQGREAKVNKPDLLERAPAQGSQISVLVLNQHISTGLGRPISFGSNWLDTPDFLNYHFVC